MAGGEGVEKMMGEGDGEEKDTALLLNLIVKGRGHSKGNNPKQNPTRISGG